MNEFSQLDESALIRRILSIHDSETFSASELVGIDFDKLGDILTHSEILRKAGVSQIYCFKLTGLEGLFSKEDKNADTFAFGRKLCDLVKTRHQSYGFFTTDEIPRYGIKRRHARVINNIVDKQKGEVVIILAYPENLAIIIREFIIKYLELVIEEG